MSSFPRSPRLFKGAIIAIDDFILNSKVISFQYNPDTITRSLTPKHSKAQGSNAEAFRLEGAPDETINVDVELDATDQLESPGKNLSTVLLGISPQLAALETIMYPSPSQIISNAALAKSGTKEIIPPVGPLTLFIFGATKVLPVKITKYDITEEAYDANLNPIRAKVKISMSVLTYADLQQSQLAYSLYQVNHVGKEVMAKLATLNSISSMIGIL